MDRYIKTKAMSKVVIAEYDAKEKALRLEEPLAGVSDHERVRVSIEERPAGEIRPWLSLRGVLSAEAGDSLARAIDEMFGTTE